MHAHSINMTEQGPPPDSTIESDLLHDLNNFIQTKEKRTSLLMPLIVEENQAPSSDYVITMPSQEISSPPEKKCCTPAALLIIPPLVTGIIYTLRGVFDMRGQTVLGVVNISGAAFIVAAILIPLVDFLESLIINGDITIQEAQEMYHALRTRQMPPDFPDLDKVSTLRKVCAGSVSVGSAIVSAVSSAFYFNQIPKEWGFSVDELSWRGFSYVEGGSEAIADFFCESIKSGKSILTLEPNHFRFPRASTLIRVAQLVGASVDTLEYLTIMIMAAGAESPAGKITLATLTALTKGVTSLRYYGELCLTAFDNILNNLALSLQSYLHFFKMLTSFGIAGILVAAHATAQFYFDDEIFENFRDSVSKEIFEKIFIPAVMNALIAGKVIRNEITLLAAIEDFIYKKLFGNREIVRSRPTTPCAKEAPNDTSMCWAVLPEKTEHMTEEKSPARSPNHSPMTSEEETGTNMMREFLPRQSCCARFIGLFSRRINSPPAPIRLKEPSIDPPSSSYRYHRGRALLF